ncbi:MerR family transcriptional regulator [Agrococcus sp. ARC_14]|uniref:helix-turn-helix domain-containing protein n=1 Tax=Agrococcus sp. ARC_14 TaxID=2919927 RepID=UPI001F05B766|nr:MerR family transcriptional regulator [Agrococcus sp. ARC_14]MCH1881938.1 MerR family transcriptional regulator [Agrococcus sp. ARC_14]
MAWSTRELAELAGTTVNTVRHYHRLGLLEVPERRVNGYKQYGVSDLVRLLRIRRLVDLGVPLSQIGEMRDGGDSTGDALRAVDAELAARIEHLQQARADIVAILEGRAPADSPRGFEAVASQLSEADSSIIHLYSQLYDRDALDDLRQMVEDDVDEDAAFNALAPDADEQARSLIAEQLAPRLAQHFIDYPWLRDPAAHLSKSEHVTQATFVEAVVELYNPAQLDVMVRASLLAHEQLAAREADARDEPPVTDDGDASADA